MATTPVRVLIPGALRSYTRQADFEIEVGAEADLGCATLGTLFDALDHRHPGLRFRVVDEQRQLRPNMRLFVNGLGVRDLRHPLQAGDFVAVVLALSGG
jgi:molybdopterin converting factor small subunit